MDAFSLLLAALLVVVAVCASYFLRFSNPAGSSSELASRFSQRSAITVGMLFQLRNALSVDCLGCAATGPVQAAPGGPPDPYVSCKRKGVKRLARELSTPTNRYDVALAWGTKYSNRNPDVRQDAIARCLEGLRAT